MLRPLRKLPWKPNWWTILPVLASLVLWGGIIYAGAWTGSALSDNNERVASISTLDEAATAQ